MTKKKQAKGSKVTKTEDKDEGMEFIPSPGDFETIRSSIEKRTEGIPCPELNDVFSVPKGKNVTFIVSQCDLSTYLRLQGAGLFHLLERQGQGLRRKYHRP